MTQKIFEAKKSKKSPVFIAGLFTPIKDTEKLQTDLTQQEINLIVKLNMGLVKSIARKHRFSRAFNQIDIEDLEQAGTFGLIKAAHMYDVRNAKGASFYTYAYRWVLFHVTNHKEVCQNPIRPTARTKNTLKYHYDY